MKTTIKNTAEKINMMESLHATKGDRTGEINLHWDAVENAHCYIVQICDNIKRKQTWKIIDIVNDSSYTAAGLKKDQNYAFRIAFIGKSGQSCWSNPVIKKI